MNAVDCLSGLGGLPWLGKKLAAVLSCVNGQDIGKFSRIMCFNA
jgi:hypothetical protein